VVFALERDPLYVVVSVTILGVLLGSLAFSRWWEAAVRRAA